MKVYHLSFLTLFYKTFGTLLNNLTKYVLIVRGVVGIVVVSATCFRCRGECGFFASAGHSRVSESDAVPLGTSGVWGSDETGWETTPERTSRRNGTDKSVSEKVMVFISYLFLFFRV